jgi:hypothetical protein
MPAIICYVRTGGREIQMRVRFSQRVAMPLSDMPWPEPPKKLLLSCSGFTVQLKYVMVSNGFAVYYISSVGFDMLIDLIYRHCNYEPCRLPCNLMSFQPSANSAPA